LFYEKGINLLKEKGILTFITSNKWMRAGYGEKLREFFSKNDPMILIDLGPGVFESATVDTNILIIKKYQNEKHNLHAVTIKSNKNQNVDINSILKNDGVILSKLSKDSWTISGNAEMKLKEKIERIGTPLKDWDIKISYGIRTGFNEAFIIDGKKKDELIAADPKSAEIIKPILRGRDIKRYKAEFADLWIIVVKKNFANEFMNKYHVLYNYVKNFENELKNRGQVKNGSHHWIEIDNSPTDAYLEEFEKEKIVWNRIASIKLFSLVKEPFLIQDSMHFITGSDLNFISSILNSTLYVWLMNLIIGKAVGGNAGNSDNVRKLPIPKISEEAQQPFIEKVNQILSAKERGEDTCDLEREIDAMVYQLYELTAEEIAIVEGK